MVGRRETLILLAFGRRVNSKPAYGWTDSWKEVPFLHPAVWRKVELSSCVQLEIG
jgi:hypothetical protein